MRRERIPDGSEKRCTTVGKALVRIGAPPFWGGLIGVLITGIMFGVRKGKLRRLNDRMAYEKSRAVRWDAAGSRRFGHYVGLMISNFAVTGLP